MRVICDRRAGNEHAVLSPVLSSMERAERHHQNNAANTLLVDVASFYISVIG